MAGSSCDRCAAHTHAHVLMPCSRERVRLSDELQRAEQQVQRSRDIIREALRFCDEAEAHKCIPEGQYDDEGELDNEAIFCARWVLQR